MRHAADDGRLMHAHLKINGESLMLQDHFPEHHGDAELPDPAEVTILLQVQELDVCWRRACNAGASVEMEMEDQFWGDRYGQIRDPFGHVWAIGAPSQEPSA